MPERRGASTVARSGSGWSGSGHTPLRLPGQALRIEQDQVVLGGDAGPRGRPPAPAKPPQQDAWLGPSVTAAAPRHVRAPSATLHPWAFHAPSAAWRRVSQG